LLGTSDVSWTIYFQQSQVQFSRSAPTTATTAKPETAKAKAPGAQDKANKVPVEDIVVVVVVTAVVVVVIAVAAPPEAEATSTIPWTTGAIAGATT
jgi:hypothetical protein